MSWHWLIAKALQRWGGEFSVGFSRGMLRANAHHLWKPSWYPGKYNRLSAAPFQWWAAFSPLRHWSAARMLHWCFFFRALNSSVSQHLGIKLRGLSGHKKLAQPPGGSGCHDARRWDSEVTTMFVNMSVRAFWVLPQKGRSVSQRERAESKSSALQGPLTGNST